MRLSATKNGAISTGRGLGNELWDKAGTAPSLDLQFADNKSLADATTGSDLVTFTRSSNGTFVDSAGVLQTAATDVPRFDHNPTTGESLGLLVEEQRTNLMLQSEDFSTTWSVNGSTSIATNTIASPASTLTADTLTVSAGGANRVSQSYSVPSAGTYTLSVYAKAGTGNLLQLRQFLSGNDAYVVFNFTTGVMGVVSGGTSASATATALPNGWYRLVLTNTYSDAALINIRIGGAVGSSETNTTFYLWGAQLEAGAFPTSYIPTTTAAVTRNADVASITGSAFSGWYRQDEGTVFVDCKVIGDNGSNQFIYSISDGALGDEIRLFKPSTNSSITNGIEDSVNGTTSNIFANANTPFGQSFKTAYAFANNYASRAANGLATEVDNSVTVPSVNQIRIGARMNGTFYSNLYLSRLTYWPQHLADSTLQQITQ
jgi:hypothetical protein